MRRSLRRTFFCPEGEARCLLPAFLCAYIFTERETSGYEAASATWNWSVWRCGENVRIKLSFKSGLLRLATRILQIILLKLCLFSLSHISSSISKLCYLNLHLYNVSMFHVTESRCNLIQYGKQQTVSELYMDKIVLRAKWKYPDKKYELRYCVFLAHFFL